jgi:hypothetical protein
MGDFLHGRARHPAGGQSTPLSLVLAPFHRETFFDCLLFRSIVCSFFFCVSRLMTDEVNDQDGFRDDVDREDLGQASTLTPIRLVKWAFVALLTLVAVLLIIARMKTGEVSRREMVKTHFKEVYEALLNYESFHDTLPSPTLIVDGNPQSWRTLCDPYCRPTAASGKIDLTQAWDSEGNLKASDVRGSLSPWHSPADDADINQASYVLVTGPGTMFEEGRRRRMRDARKGQYGGVILAIEVHRSNIRWNEPGDLTRDQAIESIRQQSAYGEGTHVLMSSGKVEFLKSSTDADVVEHLVNQRAAPPLRLAKPDGTVLKAGDPEFDRVFKGTKKGEGEADPPGEVIDP